MKNIMRVALLSAVCVGALTVNANAAGFYIQEQSVRGLGSAFSGSTTNLEDASTIYFNPAGMTKLDGLQAQAGVNLLMPDAKLEDNGTTSGPSGGRPLGGASANPYSPSPVPNGFASYQVSEQFWVGVGITAPFGLGSNYDDGWFGRFDSTKTELQVLDIQPTIAYKINDQLSIGGGINIGHATADLRNAVILGGGVEGKSQLKGDDWGFGWSAGLQYKPWESTTFAASYKSEAHYNLDGFVEVLTASGTVFQPGVTSTPGMAKLNTPDIATFGVAHDLNDRWTLQAQATWFGWNNFGAITAIRDNGAVATSVQQNYQTTWAFAAGAEYKADEQWTLRGGMQFDETPTTDEFRTSRTPDGDRIWTSFGATYAVTPEIDLDMAATYINVDGGTIDVARGGPGGRTRATVDGEVAIFALGMKYKF